jgi:hypothetical protein
MFTLWLEREGRFPPCAVIRGSGFGQTAERPVHGAEPMTEFDP